ncbi:MAG TPA: M23 family metallopeptidase [Steroidobacteraceae bacterium]|nr:M23 family metallopeptidase [Steroidobacteraceae bacterium]
MLSWHRVLVLATLASALPGCASLDDKQWYQNAKTASTKAFNVAADSTSKALQRTQHYLAEQDVLMKFHDAGEHSEKEVLEVLHRSGIAHGRSGAGGTAKSSGTPQPATHATGSTQAGTHASAPTSVPIQYAGALRWPVQAGIVSSKYGPRWGKMHKGLDIAADVGEPVLAIAGGDVIYAGDGLHGYGNVVIIQHDKQMTSLYAHNSELKVHQGDRVKQGAVIALLGNTGHSTGPHVHFEIREGDSAVDPAGVLPASMVAGGRGQPQEPRQRVTAGQ